MTLVLGIESSCDETAAAVVRDGRDVLSNAVHSQIALHREHRGVVPEIASRSHTVRVQAIVDRALRDAQTSPADLDAIAVTHRPGMIGCLLIGMTAAKTMAWALDKPLVGVDHIRAHLHTAFMTEPDLALPALALVASGGHTAMYRMDSRLEAHRLGTTRDDAAGEALDKGAALLGLSYPGGPAIQSAARAGDPGAVQFPRSMLGPDSLDFSFSGLKTALLYHLRGPGLERPMPELDEQQVADLAASYQHALVDVLIRKLRRAAEQHATKSLTIGGGVARNELLRERLQEDSVLSQLQLVFPPMDLCTDNGAMVAGLGTEWFVSGQRDGLGLEPMATSRTPVAEHRARASAEKRRRK